MRKTSPTAAFHVGFVLFVATILVIATLFWVGSGKGVFSSRVEYKAYFPSTSGLVEGSRVYLSGVPVGAVSRIDFDEDLEINKVRVTLSVQQETSPRVREDSFVWLQSRGLLGDNEVHIAMGTADAPALGEGSTLPFKAHTLLDEVVGKKITGTTSELLMSLMRMLEEIQRGEGTLGQLLKNPELYDSLTTFVATLDTLGEEVLFMSREVRKLVDEVRSQRGLLGKVLFSEEYEDRISRALMDSEELLASLNRLTTRIERGEGALGKLLYSEEFSEKARRALHNMSTLADTLAEAFEEGRRGGSVAARLLSDGELGEDMTELVERLQRSARSLEAVLGLLERGEGSLGMVLHDPSIAASMRNIFLGVQEKGYVKNMIRNAEMAGQEVALREARMARKALSETGRVEAAVSRGTSEEGEARRVRPAAARGEEASP